MPSDVRSPVDPGRPARRKGGHASGARGGASLAPGGTRTGVANAVTNTVANAVANTVDNTVDNAVEKNGARGDSVRSSASVVDEAVAHLREALMRGSFAPGQRLVEADLVAELGVSRASVRSALERLAAEGLVRLTAHRGAVARRMSRREVEELYAVRERLEGLAAALAAGRVAAGAKVQPLRRALADTLIPSEGDPERYAGANQRFHQEILRLADNRQLTEVLTRLNLPVFRLQFRGFLKPRVASRSASDHAAIAAAIEAGRGGEAERAMRAHVRRSAAVILGLPDHLFGPDEA